MYFPGKMAKMPAKRYCPWTACYYFCTYYISIFGGYIRTTGVVVSSSCTPITTGSRTRHLIIGWWWRHWGETDTSSRCNGTRCARQSRRGQCSFYSLLCCVSLLLP